MDKIMFTSPLIMFIAKISGFTFVSTKASVRAIYSMPSSAGWHRKAYKNFSDYFEG